MAVAVIHEQEEGSRKKMAVLDSCICSFSCTGCPGCRQVRFSIRTEECAGSVIDAALLLLWPGGGAGADHTTAFCVSGLRMALNI